MSDAVKFVEQLVQETSPADDFPRLEMQSGGRIGFDKGGIAKVIEYINSLPDGTEVSTKDIRDFIEKNNIDANSTSIRNMIAGSAPGRERFKDTIKFVDQTGVVKFNEETFKKIDDLLEDPKTRSFRDLGEGLGYKTPKPSGKRGVTVGGGTPLSRKSPVLKAYVKSRGGDPFEGFKVGVYKRGQPKVEKVLELQAKGMSTNSIADKLFKGNRTNVGRIFRLFRPEAIKSPTPKADDPTTTTKTRASARRQKREAEAFKKAGEKTARQTKGLIDKIKDTNSDILKMSNAEILADKNLRYAMSIDATGLRKDEPIKFDKYKNLSNKEYVAKVRDKARKKTLFTPEHISEVAKEKLNTAFPNNIVNAPGRMGSQVQAMKDYLRKNPNGEFAGQIDDVLRKTNMQFKTAGKTFGIKSRIIYNQNTGTSNIIESSLTKFKPITKKVAQSSGPTLGMNIGLGTGLKTLGEVAGSPAAALALATMTVRDNLRKGESLPAAVADKLVGAELLLPGVTSRFAPGVMRSITGLGRAARLFTPVGLGITAAGVVKDVVRESKRRAALSDEERLKEDLERQETTDELMVGAAKGGLIPPKSGKTPHGDKGLASLADYDMTNTEFINGRY